MRTQPASRASRTRPRRSGHAPKQAGTRPGPWRGPARSARLPTGNESGSIRALVSFFFAPLFFAALFFAPFALVQDLANLRQLLPGGFAGRESAQDQALGRAVEGALEQIAGELPL